MSAILDPGIEWKALRLTEVDLQFINARSAPQPEVTLVWRTLTLPQKGLA